MQVFLHFVHKCHCAEIYIVSFIVQGCVFNYQRSEAIKIRRDISDALFDILSTGTHKGAKWTVNTKLNKTDPNQTRKH